MPQILVTMGWLLLASAGDGAKVPAIKMIREGPEPGKAVDVLFVGDGYTKSQIGRKYLTDVQRYNKRFFEDEPFKSWASSFTVRALMLESKDDGCDDSPDHEEHHTALECHLDKPDGRLITFKEEKKLADLVSQAGDVDIVLVMVNTETYGGAGTELSGVKGRSGWLPAPTFSAQDTRSFLIALHELGHSFGGLGDEYVDEPLIPQFPMPKDDKDLDPPNLTLVKHFDDASFDALKSTLKWKHFLELPGAKKEHWLYEGGFYRPKGVFHPWKRCRMLENDSPFCPICEEEMAKAIVKCTGGTWDDEAFHKRRPLSQWK